ncbi:hypothetical protein APHAL10511_002285 [Amanita phalloides]|nr:hypothetical protein APHAL10511_002285 [Amanita phalloides]
MHMSAIRIGFLLALFIFIGYSPQIFIIWPWYSHVNPIEQIKLLLPFNFLVGMLLWSYILCVTTDPGGVPDYWNLSIVVGAAEAKKKQTYCWSCEKYKPTRSHHCVTCNKCVLRKDHHCEWLNNCIGQFNHGHYLRFHFYTDLTCIYNLVMLSYRLYDSPPAMNWNSKNGSLSMELIIIALNYLACISVLSYLLRHSVAQLLNLLRNRTSIEKFQESKLTKEQKVRFLQHYLNILTMHSGEEVPICMSNVLKIRYSTQFIQDLGSAHNIESLFGPKVWLWWWPSQRPGDGLKFPIIEGSEEPWPPRDQDEADATNVDYGDLYHSFDPKLHDSASLRPRRAILFTASQAED